MEANTLLNDGEKNTRGVLLPFGRFLKKRSLAQAAIRAQSPPRQEDRRKRSGPFLRAEVRHGLHLLNRYAN